MKNLNIGDTVRTGHPSVPVMAVTAIASLHAGHYAVTLHGMCGPFAPVEITINCVVRWDTVNCGYVPEDAKLFASHVVEQQHKAYAAEEIQRANGRMHC